MIASDAVSAEENLRDINAACTRLSVLVASRRSTSNESAALASCISIDVHQDLTEGARKTSPSLRPASDLAA